MKKENSNSSIVHGGGWKETEVTETFTVHGFRYYLFWFIVSFISLIITAYSHLEMNEKLFVWESTSPFLIIALAAQLFLTWKLIKTHGQKTKTETVTYKIETSNPDYDERNLY